MKLIDPDGMRINYSAEYSQPVEEGDDQDKKRVVLKNNDVEKRNTFVGVNYEYSSMDEAVIAASQLFNDFGLLNGNEWGCFIVYNGKRFGFTNFVEGTTHNWLSSDEILSWKTKLKIYAWWHNHPSIPMISGEDVAIALQSILSVYATHWNGWIEKWDYNKAFRDRNLLDPCAPFRFIYPHRTPSYDKNGKHILFHSIGIKK